MKIRGEFHENGKSFYGEIDIDDEVILAMESCGGDTIKGLSALILKIADVKSTGFPDNLTIRGQYMRHGTDDPIDELPLPICVNRIVTMCDQIDSLSDDELTHHHANAMRDACTDVRRKMAKVPIYLRKGREAYDRIHGVLKERSTFNS